ncbi:MAG: hypothetical protein OXT65_04715 [Alphaproteobacteria bacterium]|nr:hypothetical protein [Alphaproteobacteria bacterium]
MFGHLQNAGKDQLFKSMLSSLLVCVPTFCLSVYIMEARHFVWPAALTMLAILGLACGNFALVVFLEHYRKNIGGLTLHALLGAVAVVFIFLVVSGINRFVKDFGYDWLFPVIAVYLVLSFLAIFKEKVVLLKLHLGINSIVVAILWTLGTTDKITLPF